MNRFHFPVRLLAKCMQLILVVLLKLQRIVKPLLILIATLMWVQDLSEMLMLLLILLVFN